MEHFEDSETNIALEMEKSRNFSRNSSLLSADIEDLLTETKEEVQNEKLKIVSLDWTRLD